MLLDTWTKLRKQLDQQDDKVLERIVTTYGLTYARIKPDIDALTEYMEAQDKAGKLTKETLKKSAAYRNLIKAVDNELTDYTPYLRTEVSTAATVAGESGLSGGYLLLLSAMADALGVAIKDIPGDQIAQASPDALSFLAEYLRKDGPLFQRIDNLSGYHGDAIAKGILDLVGEGKNPRIIADWVTDAYGMGLTDSLRICRTTQLYSYRQANNASQVANADILDGVVWCAELDDLTCMSCTALHGQIFPVGSLADDHHNGRCAMIPLVKGADNPIEKTGLDWFTEQPESTQISMMGQSKYEAWKDHKFNLTQLSTKYNDEVFGEMRTTASLKEILGE